MTNQVAAEALRSGDKIIICGLTQKTFGIGPHPYGADHKVLMLAGGAYISLLGNPMFDKVTR